MISNVIGSKLRSLRRRERLLGVAWGIARLVAVVFAVLAICCYVDWRIDIRRDTPFALRVAMLVGQIALAVSLFVVWVMKPLVRRRSDDDLALFVEDQTPALAHRLISAVQLNRPTAKTAGMSPVLIAEVTGEAEEHARRIDVRELTDERRLWKAGGIVAFVAIFAAAAWLASVKTLPILLARQMLGNDEIPRLTGLGNATAEVWPIGEPRKVRVLVVGDRPADWAGEMRLTPDGGASSSFITQHEQISGALPGGHVTFDYAVAEIPGHIGDFMFEAWLGDGRLKTPGHVRRVPRPAIVKQDAWLVLPPHCGTHPNGERYRVEQPRGEVLGLPGSSAYVGCKTQKPITNARVEMLGVAQTDKSVTVKRTIDMQTQPDDPSQAISQFELKPDELAYRIVVTDEHGFENNDPPRRGIKIVPEEAPTVTLLPEQFLPEHFALVGAGAADDFEVEGVPIPLGGAIRIAYTAAHPYGLGKATFWYRINETNWRPFPLGEVAATEQSGPFDLRRGAFANSRAGDQVQWHAMPSRDPERVLPRTEGGGRFDFQTRALPELKIGDRIEYYVEATNREPGEPKAGRSETRMKTVVTVPQLVQWIDATLRQEDRIRQLEQKQKSVFPPK